MIIKAITLENFKGIREPVRIDFAPLTLLFGPNNAGKSTIVQALMYTREVLERNNCNAGRTELGGDVVDLGGFRNLVHAHDDAHLTIRMRFELDPSVWDLVEFDFYLVPQTKLTQPWIEIEIGQPKTDPRSVRGVPTVIRYAAGNGLSAYAEITLNENSGNAEISFLDSKVFPVLAARYVQGDLSNLEWCLSRIVRAFIRKGLDKDAFGTLGVVQLEIPDGAIGFAKGASVAMPDEAVDPAENSDCHKMSREDFDALVAQIVHGEGAWGDDAVDPATGKPQWRYERRNELIKIAEAADREREVVRQFRQEMEQKFAGKELDGRLMFGPRATDDSKLLRKTDFLPNEFRDTLELSKEYDGFFILPMVLWNTRSALPKLGVPLEHRDVKLESILRSLSPYIVGPAECLRDALAQAIYLGPYRRLPSRYYPLPGASTAHDWASGLEAWQLLIREGSQPLVESVNGWLSLSNNGLRTGYVVDVQRGKTVKRDSPLWRALMSGDLSVLGDFIRQELSDLPELATKLELKNSSNEMTLAPQDLGVGISQVIPVLVAALQNEAVIVAIEEPESNIHPAWQVVLADLFITQAKTNPDVLFLVETHSEHLMLRCLRRIRETAKGVLPEAIPAVTPEDIAVHFVESTDSGPRIRRIEIDEDGDFIDEWPGGFFEESYREKFAGR